MSSTNHRPGDFCKPPNTWRIEMKFSASHPCLVSFLGLSCCSTSQKTQDLDKLFRWRPSLLGTRSYMEAIARSFVGESFHWIQFSDRPASRPASPGTSIATPETHRSRPSFSPSQRHPVEGPVRGGGGKWRILFGLTSGSSVQLHPHGVM